jgi:hypothetical protein
MGGPVPNLLWRAEGGFKVDSRPQTPTSQVKKVNPWPVPVGYLTLLT